MLVSLPVDANVLPVIQDGESGTAAAQDSAPSTPASFAAPGSATDGSGAAAVIAGGAATATAAELKSSTPVWTTALTSSFATAAETAAQMAAVPQRMITDAIWPKEQKRTSAEELVLHNNAVLRSHFLQLTQSFLAPFESFILMMMRRGKVAMFSEKDFLEFVRAQRPLREYTGRDLVVLDLYQRFCRSVNFHFWLTARLDIANAHQAAEEAKH
jgi:hypothetical protein